MAQSQPLLIAAAADLAPLQAPLEQAFHRASGLRVRFTLASSGTLARQIQQGAPFDAYLSANQEFVRELVESGHLETSSVRTYAFGRIALWSQNGAIRSLDDLPNPRVLHVAIANPTHAPYGLAAQQALERCGLWPELKSKIVYGENVRQTLQYAESGNADAAITAWSLVFDRGGILLPDSWHAPIRQAGGVVAASRQKAAARRFMDFLTGPQGQALLKQHGLSPAAPTPSDAPGRKRPSSR